MMAGKKWWIWLLAVLVAAGVLAVLLMQQGTPQTQKEEPWYNGWRRCAMGDVLYIQTEKNRKITDPHVRLGDIADLTSNNPEVLQRCKVLRVLTLEPEKYGRYTVSAMELIWLIQKKEEKVEVDHVGEPQFILTYEDPAGKNIVMSWLKTAFVCLITFFGTMFSIMTFNMDVDIPTLLRGSVDSSPRIPPG